MILRSDLLGTQMFLDRHWEVRPALDGGIIGDNEHFAIGNATNASDNARTWTLIVVKVSCRQRREFQERRARVEQTFDPFTDEEFALLFLALAIFFAAPLADAR